MPASIPLRLPRSSGTTAVWIGGGFGRGRRRNVPQQIEQLTLSSGVASDIGV